MAKKKSEKPEDKYTTRVRNYRIEVSEREEEVRNELGPEWADPPENLLEEIQLYFYKYWKRKGKTRSTKNPKSTDHNDG